VRRSRSPRARTELPRPRGCNAQDALAEASELESRATALGVPRYTCVARLLAHRANHALGLPVDPGAVAADLDLLDSSLAIEAWRWTCDVAADFANPALDRAAGDRRRHPQHAPPHAVPRFGRGVAAGPQARGQLSSAAARTEFISHHASSSS